MTGSLLLRTYFRGALKNIEPSQQVPRPPYRCGTFYYEIIGEQLCLRPPEFQSRSELRPYRRIQRLLNSFQSHCFQVSAFWSRSLPSFSAYRAPGS